MNYNIYNSIYKELLQDDQTITIHGLLTKYSLLEKELLNLLLQIQKNEYLSSNHNILSKLIEEMNYSSSLDIYEIISSKEDTLLQKDKNNLNSHELKESPSKNNKYIYLLLASFTIILLLVFIIFYNYSNDEIKKDTIKESENSSRLKDEEISTKINISENSSISNEIKMEIKEEEPEDVIKKEQKEEIVVKKDENKTIETMKVEKENITLTDIKQIENYQKELKFVDNKILYNEHYYNEGEYLFGFKIFKITESNVKFEDEKNNIRKTLIFIN